MQTLQLRNFKSFEAADIKFCPRLNVIIGENGTGKTNVIKGILKVLGPTYPSGNSLQPADHYQFDESLDVGIWLIFKEGQGERVVSFSKQGDRYKLLIDGDFVSSSTREGLCPLHIPPERTIPELPGSNRWNPLGRIIGELSKLVEADGNVMQAYEQKSEELHAILEQSEAYREFKSRLQEYSADQLGARGEQVKIELGVMDAKKVLRSLQLFEEVHGETYNVSEGGQGIQSNLVIAALRAFAHIIGGRVFVVVDEPEAYLHPLAQRAMADMFEGIAAAGTQVIVSTHSPHFVPREPTALTRVSHQGGKSIITQFDLAKLKAMAQERGIAPSSDKAKLIHLARLMSVEVREGLFARSVVVCEGESESDSLATWAKQLGHDFAKLGIAVVQAKGKFSVVDVAEFYRVMGIPVFLVFDSDSTQQKHIRHNRWLLAFAGATPQDFPEEGVGELYAVFSHDLEDSLRRSDGNYAAIETKIDEEFGLRPGGNKGMRARAVAEHYSGQGLSVPPPMKAAVAAIVAFHARVHQENPEIQPTRKVTTV